MLKLSLKNKRNGNYHAVIETPKDSRNKYAFDNKSGLFRLKRTLPEGMVFPFDFGFIPQTIAEDEDPLDILLLMDETGYPGCFVEVKLIGVIEALQTEDGKTIRNDRLMGVACTSVSYKDTHGVKDLNKEVIRQTEMFFKNYNKLDGKKFKLLGCKGPQKALKLLEKAHLSFNKRKRH